MRATQRLYLTWDKKRVVPESNPDGRTLLCKPGDEIPEELVKQYGLRQDQSMPVDQPAKTPEPAGQSRKSKKTAAAAGQGKPKTPGEDLDTRTDDELLGIAEKMEVEIPDGGREALIVAILKKAGYAKEAEEREKKLAAPAKNKMAETPPNKGGVSFPPESRRQ